MWCCSTCGCRVSTAWERCGHWPTRCRPYWSSPPSTTRTPSWRRYAPARGYLLKDVTLEQLVKAIATVASGGSAIQPAVTDTLLRRLEGQPTTFERFDRPQPLTPRETEILRLVARGYTNREITAALYLNEGTVKNHVTSVLEKLGVRDRTRAALRGPRVGDRRDR